jgi:hypothetical protein
MTVKDRTDTPAQSPTARQAGGFSSHQANFVVVAVLGCHGQKWIDERCISRRYEDQDVGRRGLEPRTYGLKVHSSAIELAARWVQGYRWPRRWSRRFGRRGVCAAQPPVVGLEVWLCPADVVA